MLPFSVSSKAEPAGKEEPLNRILEHLRKNLTNRPKKKKTLLSHLKCQLGKDATDKLTASSTRVDYDQAGKVVPSPAPAADGKERKAGGDAPIEPEPKKQWFLLLLALGGGGALWWRARRPAVRQALA